MKKTVIVVIGFVACLGILSLIGCGQDTEGIEIQKMEQACLEATEYLSTTSNEQTRTLTCEGEAESSDELNAGCVMFTDGEYTYYYDSDAEKLRKIESLSDFDLNLTPVYEEEILDTADQLLSHVVGSELFSECSRTVSEAEDTLSYTIEYTAMNREISVPVGSITYLYDGTLFSAYFNNTDVLEGMETETITEYIDETEALALAQEEAVSFIKEKFQDDAGQYELDEESVEIMEKKYYSSWGTVCWSVSMSYFYGEYEVCFEILVDAETGEIVENANNYT